MTRSTSGLVKVQTRRVTRLGIGAWLVTLVCVVAGCSDATGSGTTVAHPVTWTTTTVPGGDSAPSLIANLSARVTRYDAPNGSPVGTIAPTWNGAPSALPVIDRRDRWLEVRLVSRPNGGVGWVRGEDVTLTQTPYRIVIHLGTRRLQLFEGGRQVLDAPAGIGTPTDPTPTGEYFVALFERPPSPGYGPFVIVTSAHSNTISDWQESGDAVIAIHGPLGAGSRIGSTGAAVSHGCVRLQDRDLVRLRPVPAGTPISIVD